MTLTPRMDRPANSHTSHLTTHPTRTPRKAVIGPVANRAELAKRFASHGWEVTHAESGKDARKLAMKLHATVVIVPARGEPETGWMTCLKLMRTGKKQRVILIGELGDREAECFSHFAGATAYLTAEDGLDAIWDAATLPAIPVS